MNSGVDVVGLSGGQVRECNGSGINNESSAGWNGNSYRTDGSGTGQPGNDVAREKAGLLTPSLFECAKEKCSLFQDGSAERRSVLNACEGRTLVGIAVDDGCERVPCLNALVPNKAKYIATQVVGSTFRYDVHDTARCAAEFRKVRIRRDLIFLYCFLRNGAPGGIDRVVGEIRAVDLHERRTSALASDVQAGCRGRSDRPPVVAADSRDRQCETSRASFVDGQVLNAGLIDSGRYLRSSRLNELDRFPGHIHDRILRPDLHRDSKLSCLTDRKADRIYRHSFEGRSLGGNFVFTGGQTKEPVRAVFAARGGALDVSTEVPGSDGGARHDSSVWIHNGTREVGSARLSLGVKGRHARRKQQDKHE